MAVAIGSQLAPSANERWKKGGSYDIDFGQELFNRINPLSEPTWKIVEDEFKDLNFTDSEVEAVR
jgi:hypothetical protein